MIKVIGNNAWKGTLWDEDTPRVALIKYASNGLSGMDKQAFVKRASEETSEELLRKVAQMEVKPGEELIHLIAMGTTEAYGPNRNGDGFSKKACIEYHPTFVKHAHFYRNHKNKDPEKSYGIVKASAFNPVMQRVELIVALNGNEKAAKANNGLVASKEMEKLASGDDLAVSMACLKSPDYPVLTRDSGYKRIEDINTDDYVWTKDSGWKKVIQVNRRRYTGDTYKFYFNGLPFPLEITEDHLLAAKSKPKDYKSSFVYKPLLDRTPIEWVAAKDLNIGDYIITKPVTDYSGFGAIDSEELAVILGYYLAEGSTHHAHNKATAAVEFTCNIADELPRLLPEVLGRIFPTLNVRIRPRSNSAMALGVHVHNKDFAAMLDHYIGHGVRSKRIPPEIFNAEENVKLAFLSAWMDGDGFCDSKGGHWSTCNPNLALQCRDLLLTMGIRAGIYKIDHSKCATSGMPNSGDEYTVNIARSCVSRFAKYSKKARDYRYEELGVKKLGASIHQCDQGFYAYRIKKIEKDHIVDTVVYNFEVEGDPSYSAAGLVSHNCSVPFDVCSCCGNKATKREEYCKAIEDGGMCKAGGLSKNIGKMASVDGKLQQLYADNTQPDFFDISNVFVPADRIAYSSGLIKHASADNVPFSEKSAEWEFAYDPEAPEELSLLQETIMSYQADGEKRASSVGWTDVKPLTNLHIPNSSLPKNVYKALNDCGICLPAANFIQLTQNCSFDKAASLAKIVAPLSNSCLLAMTGSDTRNNPYVESAGAPDMLYKWAMHQGLPATTVKSWVKQAAMNSFEEGSDNRITVEELNKVKNDDWIKRAAWNYGLYKLAFLQSQPEEDKNDIAYLLVSRDYYPCVF